MKLKTLSPLFSVCQLNKNEPPPSWSTQGSFFSVTQTADELSIVCEQALVPPMVKIEKDWRVLQVVGILDFSLTGILASIAHPLAEAKISIFAISTFDTDYVLVKNLDLEQVYMALKKVGFDFI